MGPTLRVSDQIHAEKYRSEGETFRGAMNRIADGMKDSQAHFYALRDILLDMRFLPAGRIQSAIGSARQVTPINCFVGRTIEDSMDGIMTAATECAKTLRMGGGWGSDFSTIRPGGDMIRSLQSTASGPVSFMNVFNSVCGTVCSAGHRRGAMMGILRVDHPDILKFIRAKSDRTSLTNFNISVAITNEFMRAVERDERFNLKFEGRIYSTVRAADLWAEIMRSNWDWAEPGVIFIDNVNMQNNLHYCEVIASTNPCFTGDTKVWTGEGFRTFRDLAEDGADVKVLTQTNDDKLVYRTMRSPRMTRRSQRLVMVTLDNGKSVRCTPDHRWFLKSGESVPAESLRPGDRIASVYRWRANSKGYMRISNGGHAPLEHHVPFEVDLTGKDVHHRNKIRHDNRITNLEVKDASLHRSEHILGDLNPTRRDPSCASRDVAGSKNPRFRHDVDDDALREMRDSGLSFAAIAEAAGISKYTAMKRLGWERPSNHKVVSVEVLTEVEDVYCGTVDETGRFFIALGEHDGVLVANCAEQPLPPFGACLLGSFNLVRYIFKSGHSYDFEYEQFRADIPHVARAMDNIIDDAIYPLPQQAAEEVSKRRMGLGVTGAANAIEALGYPYGTPEFVNILSGILTILRDEAYRASCDLADERGTFSLFVPENYCDSPFIKSLPSDLQARILATGIRNSNLTSIAPTGTISMTADNISSGIEPVFAHEYERTLITPDGPQVYQMQDYGLARFGVRGVTAAECSVDDHLGVLCAAQKCVDSAVSKTCNVGPEVTWEEFQELYFKAWRDGAKSCSTFRPSGERAGILKAKEKPEDKACRIDPQTGAKTCDD